MKCNKYEEGGVHQELLELIEWDTEHLVGRDKTMRFEEDLK